MIDVLHIVMARKPLEGTIANNILQHGVGGLNIDGTRVETLLDGPKACKAPGWDSINKANVGQGYRSNEYQQGGAEYIPHGDGRWPANVILGHLTGCRRAGIRKVKGNPHLGQKNPETVRQYGGGGFGGGRVGPGSGYTASDGTEAVEAWECQEGCPVAVLDAHSGDRPAGNWCRQTDTAHPFGGAKGVGYEQWKHVVDSGGASRYFKQVKED